ncbi:hypothetical protein BDZ45DRAFT_720499 [Acephala macrosclerotiorum]|nr:hypothetical protein BDZ45DRAFT_720499 [Acephala macrosclerotiorum]
MLWSLGVAMSIKGLPNELLLLIFGCLESQRDLAVISSCCKTFARLSTPLLYSTITCTGRKAPADVIRTIYTKPQYPKHVKHFSAKIWDDEPDLLLMGREIYMSDMDRDSAPKSWIRECLRAPERFLGPELCDEWAAAVFSNKNCGAVMALLLILLSDYLESLHFSDYWKGTIDELLYIDAAIRLGSWCKDANADSVSRIFFPKLRKVILQYEDIDTLKERAGPSCSGYLQLPSIREFQADMLINPQT